MYILKLLNHVCSSVVIFYFASGCILIVQVMLHVNLLFCLVLLITLL